MKLGSSTVTISYYYKKASPSTINYTVTRNLIFNSHIPQFTVTVSLLRTARQRSAEICSWQAFFWQYQMATSNWFLQPLGLTCLDCRLKDSSFKTPGRRLSDLSRLLVKRKFCYKKFALSTVTISLSATLKRYHKQSCSQY